MNENQPKSEIILYQTEDGVTRVEVRLQDETVWLTLAQMAELFQRDKTNVFKHVQNIFEEGELPSDRTVANFAIVQSEGDREVSREIDHFNLDVIISVGYRVKSHRCVISPFRSPFSSESDQAFHDSDHCFGAKRRWCFDCAGSDRIRQGFLWDLSSGAKRRQKAGSAG